MKTLGPLLLAFLTISGITAVDRSIFKTCDQSGFCKRLRNFKPSRSQYVADLNSLSAEDNHVLLNVDTVESGNILYNYALKISSYADGTFRAEMQEAKPLHDRYVPVLALNGDPQPDSLKVVSKSDSKLVLENSQGHKVVVHSDPLKIEFLDKDGEVAVVLNEQSQLLIEPLRSKDESEGEAVGVSEYFKSHQDTKMRGNEAISLDIGFPEASQVYGIPEHTDRLNLATTTSGEPYRLYNLDVFEYELDSRMSIYGSVPVLYAHGAKRTVGVFWHNSAETWVDVVNHSEGNVVSSLVNLVTGGQKKRVDTRFMSETGVLDVFVMMGDTPSDVFRQYTALTGTAPLPPKFSIAYHQSRWNYVNEDDVRGVDANFDHYDFPYDAIWLDIEYPDKKKYFTWDEEKFRHPTEMVANLASKGRKLVVIIDPHVKRETGFFVHDDCSAMSYYVKDREGKDYEGWCWPGASSYIDYLNPEASKYFAGRYSFENFKGTSNDVHIWNDMNEPAVFNGPEVTMPKDCRHWKEPKEGATGVDTFWEHRQIHNEYGLYMLNWTRQGMLDRSEVKLRPFILSRSVFAGTQRYAAVWTGDNAAEWGYLVASVRMCLSLAVAGVSFNGADVGGYFKYPDAELMTRWYQAGAYQPFFRAHSHIDTKRREPWLYDAATMQLLKDATRHRYALLDYWYTLFFEHTREGLPVIRPLFQEFPKEEAVYTIDHEYMLGDKLLIRPVMEAGVRSVKVYLPGAESNTIWYDVDTYEAHRANGYIDQPVTIAKIPVYQRGGTIVPRRERLRRSSALMANDPFTLVIALDDNGYAAGTIYIDDGESYEYEKKKYVYGKFEYKNNELSYSFIDTDAKYPTHAWIERLVIVGSQGAPRSAQLAQGSARAALHMTLHQGNHVLIVRKPGATMDREWNIKFTY